MVVSEARPFSYRFPLLSALLLLALGLLSGLFSLLFFQRILQDLWRAANFLS